MTSFTLDALRGDDVLGFLAALGVLRLCTDHLDDPDVGVGWPEGPWNAAVLRTSAASSVDELADRLSSVVEDTKAAGRLLPGIDDLPIRSTGNVDPMRYRVSFGAGRELASVALERGRLHSTWLRSLLSTSGLEQAKDMEDGLALAPSPLLDAGPGTVHMSRTLASSLNALSGPATLRAGLAGWRRVDYLAAYLDHRADRVAARGQDPKRELTSYGEPGAAWLALMAIPVFELRATAEGGVSAPGWSGPQRRILTWPVWQPILGLSAILSLLDHPIVRAAPRDRPGPRLSALGVTAVYSVHRRNAGKYSAALGPATLVWPTSRTTAGRDARRAGR